MKTLLLILFTLIAYNSNAQIIKMDTPLGEIILELHPNAAPNTVANFLNYVIDGDYTGSYIHRSVSNFVIQGGGATLINGASGFVPTDAPIVNEYNLPNVRDTIAMAKADRQPNSATSSWFINVADNTNSLGPNSATNPGSGGFTVFGTVISGMDVADAINQLPRDGLIPISSGTSVNQDSSNLIFTDVSIDDDLRINLGLNGAWYNPQTSGQGIMLEILPKTVNQTADTAFMAWFTFDTQDPEDDSTSVFGYAGHRWITGQLAVINNEDNSITFKLFLTTNGQFDSSQAVTNSEIAGYLRMTFEDCNTATVTYQLDELNLSGEFSVARVAEVTDLCTRLSIEAATGNR